MNRSHLEEILQLSLETGLRVQISGGDTSRVYETMRRVATGLGADQVEPSLSSTTLHLTVHKGGWSRTAMRHTASVGINFSELTDLSRLSRQVAGLSTAEFRERLEAVERREKRFSPALVMPMLGLSCAGFAALFGADSAGIAIAGVAAAIGATLRHVMAKATFKPFLFSQAAAFVSVILVLLMQTWTQTQNEVLAACALYLVPGVPLLNGTSDLLNGQYLNGLGRLTMSTVIVLGAAIGIAVALLLGEKL
jgi:uncharacterized membrane protein YjjP (DUF1212 family)